MLLASLIGASIRKKYNSWVHDYCRGNDVPTMPENRDISCKQLAKFFDKCKDHYPMSDRYIAEVHDSPDKGDCTEREHMRNWFNQNNMTGTGPYSRKVGNTGGRTCYQRLLNAASLLWIAEASGVDESTVIKAYNAAAAAGDYRRACGAIRRIIPWETIYSALTSTGKIEVEKRSLFRFFRR